MDYSSFSKSIELNEPPDAIGAVLTALWKVAKGEWEEAHTLVQDLQSEEAAWVHAYLHRVEGDVFNAKYWYQRAGRPEVSGDLEIEWKQIVMELLSKSF